MMASERKNNRGKIQIMGDVLSLATSGIKKTHIMYRANLSYEQVYLYLEELISKRLIAQDVSADGVVYRTTEKGKSPMIVRWSITEKGRDIIPILLQFTAFGSKWHADVVFKDKKPRKPDELFQPKARRMVHKMTDT